MPKVLVEWERAKGIIEVQEVEEELAKRLVAERDDYEYHDKTEKKKEVKPLKKIKGERVNGCNLFTATS